MILKVSAPVHVHNRKKCKRKNGGDLPEPETKKYKID